MTTNPTTIPPWVHMWLIALTLYGLCKLLTLRGVPRPFSRPGAWIYLLAWPGMNGPGFFRRAAVRPVVGPVFGTGPACLTVGLGVFWIADGVAEPLIRGLLGMVAVVLVLHFGLFRILADFWSARGWNAPPLMHAPLASRSLSEFWGRRWNRAFRDLTHRFLFRPLARRTGPRRALLLGFALSGLAHELVITLPAGGGFGGPTLYFLLQASGLLLERRLRHPGLRRTWMAAVLILPLPLLFPPPFVLNVMAPFVDALPHS